MVKIAHLSDIHVHNLKYLKEQRQVFNTTYQRLEEEAPDLILVSGDVFNRLSIVSKRSFGDPLIVLDLKADGSLNEITNSREKPDKYQSLYESVLKRGLDEGQIIQTGEQYEVLANAN